MKHISKWKLIILSTFAQGYIIFPMLLISALADKQPGTVDFLMPVVVIYTVQRTCLIGLRGFGEIQNPYKIMRNGLWIALAGALCIPFSFISTFLLQIGAMLIGIGLSPFAAMYAPLQKELINREPSVGKVGDWGNMLSLLFAVMLLFLPMLSPFIAPILFIIYIAAMLIGLYSLNKPPLFDARPSFDTSKRRPVFFIFSAIAFISLSILRQYRTSGVSVLLPVASVICAIGIVMEIFRKRRYEAFIYETGWTGAMRCFIVLYNLIYYTFLGQSSMKAIVYVALIVGVFLTEPIGKVMKRRLSGKRLSQACLLLSACFAFLMIVPVTWLKVACMAPAFAFTNLTAAQASYVYMANERHVPQDRALAKLRISTSGSIIMQLIIFETIYFLGEGMGGGNLLAASSSQMTVTETGAMLRIVGLICCTILFITACLIVIRINRKGIESHE